MSFSNEATKRPVAARGNSDWQDRGSTTKSESPGAAAVRVIIVGVTDKARALADTLMASKRPIYKIVGFLADPDGDAPDDLEVLGEAPEMLDIAAKLDVDEVMIASMPGWQERLAEGISINGNGHPKIRLVPSVYETMVCYPKLVRVNDLPLMTLNHDRSLYHRFFKRAFDIVFSLTALAVCAPLMAVAALLMKLTSRGPVFYRQARVGVSGREFILFKMRTMITDAEKDTGPVLSSPHDGRVTFVGRILRRLKLDEIPQFINVLKGEMSVVGPRPERRCFVDQYSEEIPCYNARHQVRPGITGMAQVFGGYTTDPAIKLKYDLMYVYGGSLWTDLKIVTLTVPVMIAGT